MSKTWLLSSEYFRPKYDKMPLNDILIFKPFYYMGAKYDGNERFEYKVIYFSGKV